MLRTTGYLLAGFGILTIVSGCGQTPQPEYRAARELSAKTADPVASTDVVSPVAIAEPPADATVVDNSAMMSVRPELAAKLLEEPVSALEIANRQVELLIPHKTFGRDKKTNSLRITYEDLNLLKVLNMDPVTIDAVSHMPEWLTSLDGQLVRVRGFMDIQYEPEGLDRFVLLRDNKECCYGPGAKIYDHIMVRMKDGTTTDYIPLQESFEVVGRFRIHLEHAKGSIYGLYSIDDAVVLRR